MRVISGIRKGHNLKTIKDEDIRPTEDRIKESLFNILGTIKNDSLVLDLFAGTGAIGIEFLSRGSGLSYFIDSSPNSIKLIKDNLSHTRLSDKAVVYKQESQDAIKKFKEKKIVFDYIYIDPPFKKHNLLYDVLGILDKYTILNPNGIIIIEHEKNLEIKDDLINFKIVDFRKYGNKSITFLKTI